MSTTDCRPGSSDPGTARRAILPLALVLSAALRAQQTAVPTQADVTAPQAIFKAGIDVVQLDVTVLDQNRLPLRGLTAADFTVLENGNPQPIVAVVPIEVPGPVTPSAPWMRDVAPDVVSNAQDVRRIVVIVMDDANTGFDNGESLVANRIVDELGPSDLAAVAFTFLGSVQNLTTDRARLRAAIDSFTPRNSKSAGVPLGCALKLGGCQVDTLAHVDAVLQSAPQGRKMLPETGAVRTAPGGSIGRTDRQPAAQRRCPGFRKERLARSRRGRT